MNCPKCRLGIMEKMGGVHLSEGPLKLTKVHDETHPFLEFYVCSRGDCGEVDLRSIWGGQSSPKYLTGYIELKPGPLELKFGSHPDNVAALELRLDNGVQIKAAPDSYSWAKRILRESMDHR